jgi:hypothetical protein
MLREQQEPPCEASAEQYQPTSVGHPRQFGRKLGDSVPQPAASG